VFAYPYIDYPECHYAHHDYWRNWRRTDFIYYASYKKTYSNEGKIQSISRGSYDQSGTTFEYYDEKGNIMEILEGGYYCGDWDYWELLYSEQKHKKLTARSDNKVGFDKKTEYSYTYDKHDNWIKRVAYYMEVNTLPVCTEIVEREIEYWK